MTKPRKKSAPASKREHLGADVMTREAKDPGATQPADKTAPPERPSSWSPEDILAIAKTLRVR